MWDNSSVYSHSVFVRQRWKEMFWVGVANLHSRRLGMAPFERALVSSYRPSILCQHSFVRNFRLEFWVEVANPQFWTRGGGRGSEMVPFERALVSSYRPSIVTYLYAFKKYCRFCAPARHFFPTPPLVSLPFFWPGNGFPSATNVVVVVIGFSKY